MLSVILTIICSSSIALIIKHNSEKKGDPLLLLAGNYLVAAIISGINFSFNSIEYYSLFTFLFGAGLGAMFLFSFFAFAKAVEAAGTALATVSSRLSVIVPVVFSIFIYSEIPSGLQVIGIVLAIVTILFFYLSLKTVDKGSLHTKDYLFLFIVLIGIGINDFALKVFQQEKGNAEEPFFLFMIFTFAFIYTVLVIIFKRIKVEKGSLIRGGILGIPNMFSSFFLLGALAALPAIIVYPTINIGVILATTIAAWIIWKENINFYGKIALLTGIVAIMLLGM